MSETSIKYRDEIQALKSLLDMFKLERRVYILLSILSTIILITCAFFLILSDSHKENNKVNIATSVGMFGSSGAIAYTTNKLLKMWNDAIIIISKLYQRINKWLTKRQY